MDNRVGNLGDTVTISQVGDGKIEVVAHTQFSGRYLKYLWVVSSHASYSTNTTMEGATYTLSVIVEANTFRNRRTKKFLKKQQLRDWLRVVSTSPGVYELRFFNTVNEDAEDDDE